MEKTNKNYDKIRSKIEAIKKINDHGDKEIGEVYDLISDDLPSNKDIIRRNIDDYKNKNKSKKTENNDIFGRLITTAESFLGSNNTDNIDVKESPKLKNRLRKYAKESASLTLHSSKQIVMDTVRNNLFGGEGVCGVEKNFPNEPLFISPKEFDFLDMLTLSPDSTTGTIMYEDDEDIGFIKMNRELYRLFDNPSSIFELNTFGGDKIFDINWDVDLQKYEIKLRDNIPYNVSDFLTDYYSTIEQPNINNIIKQTILMTIYGNGTEPRSFNLGLNKLDRLLRKLFSICGQKQNPKLLNQTPNNLINEDDIDIETYFDFDDVEGIDIDDENMRFNRVLKFVECGNFETKPNVNNLEDFVYFTRKRRNMDEMVNNVLNKVSNDAYEESGRLIPPINFRIGLNLKYLLKLPRALISAILSPKMLLPVVIIFKAFKKLEISVTEIMKKLSKLFFDIIRKIFWKFIKEFWRFIKKDLLNFIKKLAAKILKNKLKRYRMILTSLISLLLKLLKTNIGSCDEIYGAILSTINGALSNRMKIPIPGILLGLSDSLPGYSTDRAYMNIVQKLDASGIPMGDLYGRENDFHFVIKSIIEGNTEESDQNSYVKVTNQEIFIPTPVGPIMIPPGILTSNGKIF